MKKVLFILAIISIVFHSVSFSKVNPLEQKLTTGGYLLSKESNRLKLIRTKLSEISKKLQVLNELDSLELCNVNRLMENIFWAETICMYESILLSKLQSIEERKKIEQYKMVDNRLRKFILNNLYQNYKNIQITYSNINDEALLKLADEAKKELLKALRLIEETIKILQKDGKINP